MNRLAKLFAALALTAAAAFPPASLAQQRARVDGSFQLASVTSTGAGRSPASGPTALSISGTPVLTATQNSPYAGFSVSGSGGTAPYAYSSVGAALPNGVTINVSSGLFAGTPTVSGTFAGIILRVTDNVAATANLASFTLTVAASGGGDPNTFDFSTSGQLTSLASFL